MVFYRATNESLPMFFCRQLFALLETVRSFDRYIVRQRSCSSVTNSASASVVGLQLMWAEEKHASVCPTEVVAAILAATVGDETRWKLKRSRHRKQRRGERRSCSRRSWRFQMKDMKEKILSLRGRADAAQYITCRLTFPKTQNYKVQYFFVYSYD
ncbi:uncharacterized protein LOC125513224 [Triticum urartu]|uniref:uncharacterized protein LOC125513224 n=1 Tax=Triticum urartu TaxID=4572 RepID=UPI0020444370|nr:uncharacterized protein LOC125513224 [Triticum urartu]